jgi:hypothetical protein
MLISLRKNVIRNLILPLVASIFSLGALSAQAGIITPGQAINAQAEVAHLANVQAFLARDDVRQNLEALGVDPQAATERAAALSPEELAQLSAEIDELPAAGGILEVLGILLVVLIVLEILGVTNIFTSV